MTDPRTDPASGTDYMLMSNARRHVLLDANVASKPNIVAGGTYLAQQIAQSYGQIDLQMLAPDNATWTTVYSWTGADTDTGLELKLGALAVVRAVATNTKNAFLVLAQVPA